VAGYRGVARTEWVKVFAFRPDSSVTEIRFFGDDPRDIRYAWTPADGIILGVNRSTVEAVLGHPCDEEFEERYTWLVFRALETDHTISPLAAGNLADDSTPVIAALRLGGAWYWTDHLTRLAHWSLPSSP
jgi:hypothetical protein